MQISALIMLTVCLLFTAAQTSAGSADKQAEQQVCRASDEEVQAFLRNDPNAMARLWSDDLVVTNPLNKLVNKQEVLGMVQSGFLVITFYDRRIELRARL